MAKTNLARLDNARTILQMFTSPMFTPTVGFALAHAALDGNVKARLSFADWYEHQFPPTLVGRWTINELRAINA